MNALIAFDKFKHALSATELCQIAQEVLRETRPDWTLQSVPLADGGEGFCDTLTRLAGGEFRTISVTGPDGEPTQATYGRVSLGALPSTAREALELPADRQRLAIVELAQCSGLAKTPQERRSPWTTTTYGMGETIASAARDGADCVLVGLGGSATHDLALGALQALGFTFRDARGQIMRQPPSPVRWSTLASIEPPVSDLPSLPMRIACDVDHALVGPAGAAAVFGPQKGLALTDLDELDSLTSRVAIKLCHATRSGVQLMSTPCAGAAGGAAFGLMAGCGAQPLSGAELVFAWSDLATKLRQADLVLTGEGRFDASSLKGKAPGALALAALDQGKSLYIAAGSFGELPAEFLSKAVTVSITPPDTELADALQNTGANLRKAIRGLFASEQRVTIS